MEVGIGMKSAKEATQAMKVGIGMKSAKEATQAMKSAMEKANEMTVLIGAAEIGFLIGAMTKTKICWK